jgi:hypothetical protein
MRNPHFYKGKTMKLNRFGTFTLGVLVTAISVGAVSYANATGDATIKSCANKKTGAMRYISKGKCKKTETSLSWNQMGPTGLPGSSGAAGTNGADGAKGTTGAAGTNGTNGQNLFLVNNDGSDVGPVTQANKNLATLLFGGHLWDIDLQTGVVFGAGSAYYEDSACSSPLAYLSSNGFVSLVDKPASSQAIMVDFGMNNTYELTDKIYSLRGNGLTFTSQVHVYYRRSSTECTELNDVNKGNQDGYKGALYAVSEILTRPIIATPLMIVAR